MDCFTDCDCLPPSLPGEIPVMVLPDCHLFPGCLLPLFIFEKRYRDMLQSALGTDRMFCIGNREGPQEDDPVSPYSTVGLVRACVTQDDGTSHLLLLGLKRIKFLHWTQEKPFRIAEIDPIPTIIENPVEIMQMKDETLELFAAMTEETGRKLHATLKHNDNPELVCDVLSYHFTRCPRLQQKLLGEPSLNRRFQMIREALLKHRKS